AVTLRGAPHSGHGGSAGSRGRWLVAGSDTRGSVGSIPEVHPPVAGSGSPAGCHPAPLGVGSGAQGPARLIRDAAGGPGGCEAAAAGSRADRATIAGFSAKHFLFLARVAMNRAKHFWFLARVAMNRAKHFWFL